MKNKIPVLLRVDVSESLTDGQFGKMNMWVKDLEKRLVKRFGVKKPKPRPKPIKY